MFPILCFHLGKHFVVKNIVEKWFYFFWHLFKCFFIAKKRVLREWRFEFSLGLGGMRFKRYFFAWFLRAKKVFLSQKKIKTEGYHRKMYGLFP